MSIIPIILSSDIVSKTLTIMAFFYHYARNNANIHLKSFKKLDIWTKKETLTVTIKQKTVRFFSIFINMGQHIESHVRTDKSHATT